jgi:hypothetical protein
MNEFESNSGLADQVAALQRQVFLLLLALIVVSGSLIVYLWFQSHEIDEAITVTQAQVQSYDKKLPAIKNFVGELVSYGNAHPEFRPVLVKYGIETNAAPATK